MPTTRVSGCSFNKERKRKKRVWIYTVHKLQLKCKLFCHYVGNTEFFPSQSKMKGSFCVVLTETKAKKPHPKQNPSQSSLNAVKGGYFLRKIASIWTFIYFLFSMGGGGASLKLVKKGIYHQIMWKTKGCCKMKY